MLDNAMGYAASLSGDPEGQTKFMTISMSTQFIAPVSKGRIIATGTVTGGGRKIVFVDGVLHDAVGRLLATASGAFKRLPETSA
jgi:acyl-coenzyme A thioesterase PaaI-like protein